MFRKILSISICLLAIACNNSGVNDTSNSDTTANKPTTDTSHMNMGSGAVTPLPAVPAGAKVYFKGLKDNATVSSPLKLQMGVDNMKVDTVGPVVAGSGHFHIFVDAEDSLSSGTVVPKDSTHLHYGKGQTEATVSLSPGKHKLTLQFADGLHRSYGGQLATTVHVDVKK